MKRYTKLSDTLFSGDIEAINDCLARESVQRIISVIDSEPPMREHEPAGGWFWLKTDDDGFLKPEAIATVCGEADIKTLVHCQLGQNRSSAIAACYLLRHDPHWRGKHPDEVMAYVSGKRTPDLASIGRSSATISPAMRRNVSAFATYLSARK